MPSADTIAVDISKNAARTDKQLVELSLAGDENAFEEIFDRHKRLVATVASRYFRRPEQVEEIIQISFAKMYFELKNFRGEHDFSLPGWLGRITANACLDVLRSQKRKPEDLICELSDTDHFDLLSITHNGSIDEDHHINRDLAEKLLSRLTPEDQALLQMIYGEGLNIAEAARSMGWSLPKTKLRAWRAKNSLRKTLKRLL